MKSKLIDWVLLIDAYLTSRCKFFKHIHIDKKKNNNKFKIYTHVVCSKHSRWADMKGRNCMLPVGKWDFVEQKCHSTCHLRTCQRLLIFYFQFMEYFMTGRGCVFIYPKQSNGHSPIWLLSFGVGRFFNVVHLSKNIIESPSRSLITSYTRWPITWLIILG